MPWLKFNRAGHSRTFYRTFPDVCKIECPVGSPCYQWVSYIPDVPDIRFLFSIEERKRRERSQALPGRPSRAGVDSGKRKGLPTHPGSTQVSDSIGAPSWTRTSDPQLRRLMLYPPELWAPSLVMSQCISGRGLSTGWRDSNFGSLALTPRHGLRTDLPLRGTGRHAVRPALALPARPCRSEVRIF